MFSALGAANNDEKVWTEPELFKPERFLDENGHVNVKLDKSLSFSAGKRVCPGETFARNAMFLVAAAVAQNFDITMAANEKMPTPDQTHTGLLRAAPKFWMKFSPR